jgi:hypothetical protein
VNPDRAAPRKNAVPLTQRALKESRMDVFQSVDRQDLVCPVIRKRQIPREGLGLEVPCVRIGVHVHVSRTRKRPPADLDAPVRTRYVIRET